MHRVNKSKPNTTFLFHFLYADRSLVILHSGIRRLLRKRLLLSSFSIESSSYREEAFFCEMKIALRRVFL